MLRTGREHAVRFETSAGRQIIDHHPDVGLATPQHPVSVSTGTPRRVHPRYQPLSGRLLVSRGTVDLARQKQSGGCSALQSQRQFRRLDEIVFDRIAGTQHHGIFQPRQRGDDFPLHVLRQAHRTSADVDLRHIEPLGLQKDLMTLAVGKPHHLVLQRRTVPGTDSGDSPVVER